ncbi:hypothetical protein ASPFODRAFT_329983 [Aspergillus luchuensis CBS 106.47]|uniref:Uncharacterized protein n=1 Tax=Aspergillus luchuensis (strain CBS 106.47) TaxID=1137211 RepID=A0A1M3T7D9_ASPLC|nr:hypothetical protein ASPFODRAFT_329983 [Aspergillus luchuensis CBS 106.47]
MNPAIPFQHQHNIDKPHHPSQSKLLYHPPSTHQPLRNPNHPPVTILPHLPLPPPRYRQHLTIHGLRVL